MCSVVVVLLYLYFVVVNVIIEELHIIIHTDAPPSPSTQLIYLLYMDSWCGAPHMWHIVIVIITIIIIIASRHLWLSRQPASSIRCVVVVGQSVIESVLFCSELM